MNLADFDQKIYGLEPGLKSGQNERVDELNDRILARFSCDVPLKPHLSFQAVHTKYSHFHIVNEPKPTKLDNRMYPVHSSHFCPIQCNGPAEGFDVTAETEVVRPSRDTYIPSSTSDLYRVSLPDPSRQESQPFQGLFETFRIDPFSQVRNGNPRIGHEMFSNHTRNQLRST